MGGVTLPKATLAGMEIEIDEDGFIQEPEKWSEAVAEDLAKEESSVSPMTTATAFLRKPFSRCPA